MPVSPPPPSVARATTPSGPSTGSLPSVLGDDRAVSPVLGVVLLLAITVVTAGVLGSALLGQARALPGEPTRVALSATVSGDRLTLVHEGGDPLDLADARLRVLVDSEPLTHQPPGRFFSARGFYPGPSGPLNVAADPRWTVGEAVSLRVAETNDPEFRPGATVRVEVVLGERIVASAETTA